MPDTNTLNSIPSHWQHYKDLWFLIFGLIGGGIITYLVARRIIHRPTLKFTLKTNAVLRKTDFGRTFQMRAGDRDLDNLCIFSLEMHLKGKSDIGKEQAEEKNKPTLFFSHFTIHDIRTIDRDESRFDIPFSRAANDAMLIVHINRMRANTKARFQIIGSFRDAETDPDHFLAEFYPGFLHNVDMESAGQIRRPWKKQKDQRYN
jgi:hypothetical protein